MKLRSLRRRLQAHVKSGWWRAQSRFVNLSDLTRRLPQRLSFGIAVPSKTDRPISDALLASLDAQWYRKFRLINLNVAGNWKKQLSELARQTDFVAVVDDTVSLEPDALAWATLNIESRGGSGHWIYFDHLDIEQRESFGCVDDQGRRQSGSSRKRTTPVFLPDYSPEYLLTGMFSGGFNLFSSQCVLKSLDDDDIDVECLPFELALRVSETYRSSDVIHISEIGFTNEFPMSVTESNAESQRCAVERHLCRRGIQADVRIKSRRPLVLAPWFRRSLKQPITVLIPTRNQMTRVMKCVHDIRRTTSSDVQIRVIDNQSDDARLFDYYRQQEALGRFSVEHFDEPFNYARMHNQAIGKVTTRHVILVNNDVFDFSPQWIEQLVATADLSDDIGCVGTLLRYPDGLTQHGGVTFGIGKPCRHAHLGIPADGLGYHGRLQAIQQLTAVTAALMLVRRDAFLQVGGFDEELFPISYNDTDLCLKLLHSGYRTVYNPNVTAIHEESVSRGKSKREREWRKSFVEKWSGRTERDAFYSPHLSKQVFDVDEIAFRSWRAQKLIHIDSLLRAAS